MPGVSPVPGNPRLTDIPSTYPEFIISPYPRFNSFTL